nr:hypothetical protein Iba_chr11bCG12050 [Ipomoea batatas]
MPSPSDTPWASASLLVPTQAILPQSVPNPDSSTSDFIPQNSSSEATQSDVPQGAHPGSKVPDYPSSDLNGESKVLTPGARCLVTGLRTLMVRARCSPREQGARLLVFGPYGESIVLTPGARCSVTDLRTLMVRARCPVTGRLDYVYLASADGSTPSFVSPSADGPALGAATDSAVGPTGATTSADGPAETSTTGTGSVRPSGTLENGVGPGSGTSSGRTAKTFGRSSSSIATSSAVLTSFYMALRPLLKAQDPNSYIRSSPTGVREMAAMTASLVSCPLQICQANKTGSVRIFSPSTSITGVVDLDPSRRGLFAGATSSMSTVSFSFPRWVARPASSSPPKLAGRVVAKGRPVGTGASAVESAGFEGSAFLDPRLIFVAGAGGRAETGKLLIVPEKGKKGVKIPTSNQPTCGPQR